MDNLIRKAREAKGLTQEQLAYTSGVSLGTVRNLERGLQARARTVRKLADALGVSVDSLIPAEKQAV